MAISISVGLLCGLWVEVSPLLNISSWIGFAGCTCYFAAGGGLEGAKKTLYGNISGVLWASLAIFVSNLLSFSMTGTIMTIFISAVMCYQSKIPLLSFIPAAFLGSFVTFGSGGDSIGTAAGLGLGLVLGISCDYGGKFLYKIFGERKSTEKKMEVREA